MHIRYPSSAPRQSKTCDLSGETRFRKLCAIVAIREGLSGRPMTARRQEIGTRPRRRGIAFLSTAYDPSTHGRLGPRTCIPGCRPSLKCLLRPVHACSTPSIKYSGSKPLSGVPTPFYLSPHALASLVRQRHFRKLRLFLSRHLSM